MAPKKGNIPWNKGKKTGLVPKTAFKKGHTPWHTGTKGLKSAPKTAFKKGQKKTENWYKVMANRIPWNKGTKGVMPEPWNKGMEKENLTYPGLHQWVYRKLGQPDTCEFCGANGLSGKKIHWANKDHKYRHKLEDWLRLCAPCHSRYDRRRKEI